MSGLESFQRRMKAVPKAAREAVKPALVKGAEEIAAAQRALAPDDPATSAPDLRSSIKVTPPGGMTPPVKLPSGAMLPGKPVPENAAAVTAGGPSVEYATFVEYGTRKRSRPAQPFFWPGFRLARKKAMARIKRVIGKAIREAR